MTPDQNFPRVVPYEGPASCCLCARPATRATVLNGILLNTYCSTHRRLSA